MKLKKNKKGAFRISTATLQKKRRIKIENRIKQKSKQRYCMLHNKNSFIKNTNDNIMDLQNFEQPQSQQLKQRNQLIFGRQEVQLKIEECFVKKQQKQIVKQQKKENFQYDFFEDEQLKKLKAQAPQQQSDSEKSSEDGVKIRTCYVYESDQLSQLSQNNLEKIQKKNRQSRLKYKTKQLLESQSESSKQNFELDFQNQNQQRDMILRKNHKFAEEHKTKQTCNSVINILNQQNELFNYLNPKSAISKEQLSSNQQYSDFQGKINKKKGRKRIAKPIQKRQKQKESNLRFRISRGICQHIQKPDYGYFDEPQLCAICKKQFEHYKAQSDNPQNLLLQLDKFLQQKYNLKLNRKYSSIYDGFFSFKVKGYKFQKRKFTPIEQMPAQFFIFQQQYQKFYQIHKQDNPAIKNCPHKRYHAKTYHRKGQSSTQGLCSKCLVRFYYLKQKDVKSQDPNFIRKKQYRQNIDKYIRQQHYKIFQSLLFPIKRSVIETQYIDCQEQLAPQEEMIKALQQKKKWGDESNNQLVKQHYRKMQQRKIERAKKQAYRKQLKIYPQIHIVKFSSKKNQAQGHKLFTCPHYNINSIVTKSGLCSNCYLYYQRCQQQRKKAKRLDGILEESMQQSDGSMEDDQNYDTHSKGGKEGQPKEQIFIIKKFIDFKDSTRADPAECHPQFSSSKSTGYCTKCYLWCLRKFGSHMDLYPSFQEMRFGIYKYFQKVKIVCPHPERKHAGYGLCRPCYRIQYGKIQRQRTRLLRTIKDRQQNQNDKNKNQKNGEENFLNLGDAIDKKQISQQSIKQNQNLENQGQVFVKTQYFENISASCMQIPIKKCFKKRGLQLPEQIIQEKGLIRIRQRWKKNDVCGHYDRKHHARGSCQQCFHRNFDSINAIKKLDRNDQKFETNLKYLNKIRQLRKLGKLPMIGTQEDSAKQDNMKKQEEQSNQIEQKQKKKGRHQQSDYQKKQEQENTEKMYEQSNQ